MVRRTVTNSKLQLLSALEVLHAREGDLNDGGGLLLRVRGDSCSWVLRYTAATGKRREMGLGIADRGSQKRAYASLEAARDLASDKRKLLKAGTDPIDDRQRKNEAERVAKEQQKADRKREHLTLARAAREYHERVVEPRLTTKHATQWIASLEHHVPESIWHKPIDQIDAPELLAALSEVRALADPEARVPETLSRVRQRLDAVFEDAIFHKRCTSNPAGAIRRKMREQIPAKPAGKFAALPYREAPGFMSRLREAEGIAARCLELAVLTAARTGEVLGATWSEIDLEEAIWAIPGERMKSGEAHTVALSPRALEVLQSMQGLHKRWVFPSPMLDDKPISNMAMLVTLDRLGVRDRTTVHGLCRATFSTWAYETAAARPDVIEACLAHREADKVKAAYNRAQFADERRVLLAKWAEYLAHSAHVIPLRANQ